MRHIIDADVYDRQKRLTGWDQEAIAKSNCLVVGAGALGNEVVKNLVQLGVGAITLVDFDTIVSANLNRCAFFRPGDEGKLKAQVLAARASELNPDCRITPIISSIEGVGEDSYHGFTAAFSCLDSLAARLHANAHCYGTVPLIDGGTTGFFGKVQVVRSPGPCLECSLTKRDYDFMWRKYSCVGLTLDIIDPKMPALPTTTAVIAGIMAGEFIKLAHSGTSGGVNPLTQKQRDVAGRQFAFPSSTLDGKYLFVNTLNSAYREFRVQKRTSCPVHG